MGIRATALALLVGLLLSYAPPVLAQTREFSPTVAVQGHVTTPRTYTLADLQALPAHSRSGLPTAWPVWSCPATSGVAAT